MLNGSSDTEEQPFTEQRRLLVVTTALIKSLRPDVSRDSEGFQYQRPISVIVVTWIFLDFHDKQQVQMERYTADYS